jgi:hypothetical protein
VIFVGSYAVFEGEMPGMNDISKDPSGRFEMRGGWLAVELAKPRNGEGDIRT